jgi:hypothetical protein
MFSLQNCDCQFAMAAGGGVGARESGPSVSVLQAAVVAKPPRANPSITTHMTAGTGVVASYLGWRLAL